MSRLRITTLALLAVAALWGGSAFAGAADRALQIRSEALNAKYHLGGSTDVNEAARRALEIRGQALNKLYGLGEPAPIVATGSNSFSWGAFGIGAGSMLGFVLLSSGLAVAGRAARLGASS